MADDEDTNALAFERLKALVRDDATLPENVKKALVADCALTSPTTLHFGKLFEAPDAPAN